MNIKRIATITLVLLGYIALAGATQNILRYFTPKGDQPRYAEVRIGAANQLQLVICKDWTPVADDVDSSVASSDSEVVQDIYYWINLSSNAATGSFTDRSVEVSSPVQQRAYHGAINWGPGQRQITIQLYRSAASPNQVAGTIPCPANGTYTIRKTSRTPFLKAGSI